MNYQFIFHPRAGKEYLDACNWYNEELDGLGHRFKIAVENQLRQIANHPKAYPVKKKVYRESNIDVFPYLIVYKINKPKSIIYISAIYHTSRNPRKKYRR